MSHHKNNSDHIKPQYFQNKKYIIYFAIFMVVSSIIYIANSYYSHINPKLNSFASISSNTGAFSVAVNDEVQTTGQVQLRRSPPILEVYFIATLPKGTQGSVVSGPVYAANTWWWQVNFGPQKNGWVDQNSLAVTSVQSNSTAVQPTPTPAPAGLGITAPQITFLSGPANNSTTTSSVIQLTGHVVDNVNLGNLMTLVINGTHVQLNPNGFFTVNLDLKKGINNFTFFAQGPVSNPRQQFNDDTSYLDGSIVYGSDQTRENALRTFSDGMMKTTVTATGVDMPFDTENLPEQNDAALFQNNQLYLGGDIRANENIEISAVQILLLREHNLIASIIKQEHPTMSDEEIFQWARRIVIAEIQAITYNEFLPALLGPNDGMTSYSGYNQNVNPGVSDEFATSAYRFGHAIVNNGVEFFGSTGQTIDPTLSLANAFDNPQPVEQFGAGPILKYLATDNTQEVDTGIVPSLQNFLFGPPGSGGFDLQALDIQRGRDHGLTDYNSMRVAYGLPAVTSFNQITSNTTVANQLSQLYGNVNNIDSFIGGEAESHISGGSVGPLFNAVLVNQFERLRDGDRFWYQREFSGQALNDLNQLTLRNLLSRDTSLIQNLQDNAFIFNSGATSGPEDADDPTNGALSKSILTQIINGSSPTGPDGVEPINGNGNNQSHPTWGQEGADFVRVAPAAYADGVNSPSGANRPSARQVSTTISTRSGNDTNNRQMSDWVYAWGQFVDHDIDLTDAGSTVPFNIQVPKGDPEFDPNNTGTQIITLDRSSTDAATGNGTTKTATLQYNITEN